MLSAKLEWSRGEARAVHAAHTHWCAGWSWGTPTPPIAQGSPRAFAHTDQRGSPLHAHTHTQRQPALVQIPHLTLG